MGACVSLVQEDSAVDRQVACGSGAGAIPINNPAGGADLEIVGQGAIAGGLKPELAIPYCVAHLDGARAVGGIIAAGYPAVAAINDGAAAVGIGRVEGKETGTGLDQAVGAGENGVEDDRFSTGQSRDVDGGSGASKREGRSRGRAWVHEPVGGRTGRGVAEIKGVELRIGIQGDGRIPGNVEGSEIGCIVGRGWQESARPIGLVGPAAGGVAAGNFRPRQGRGRELPSTQQ